MTSDVSSRCLKGAEVTSNVSPRCLKGAEMASNVSARCIPRLCGMARQRLYWSDLLSCRVVLTNTFIQTNQVFVS